jgi:vitamin B12 transporter
MPELRRSPNNFTRRSPALSLAALRASVASHRRAFSLSAKKACFRTSAGRALLAALALAGATAALAVAGPTAAQEPPDTFRLNPIVVTATRLAQLRTTVPAAVTVLQGDALRRQGIRFIADALRFVPGANIVQVGSRGGLTSLFMRGGESDYVQVMVDGVVLNEPGGAFDIGQLTTENVERIEILRGPASVLYGSDAVTGIVHVITRSGNGPPRLSASATIGTQPRRNGAPDTCPDYPATPCPAGADLGRSESTAFDVSLSGGASRVQYAFAAGHFATNGTYAFNNDYDNRTIAGRARVAAGPRTNIGLMARWSDGRFHYPTDGAGRIVDANQVRSTESLAIGLDAGFAISSRIDSHFTISSHDGSFVTDDRVDGPADTLGSWESTNDVDIVRRKANAVAHLRFANTSTLTFGAEIESQNGRSVFTSNGQFGPFEAVSDDKRTNRAAFLQVMAAPLQALSLTGGTRVDDNDRFGMFLTWRIGANVRLARRTLLRAAAGTAFKEPTFFENYAEGFTVGNPHLEPEETRSWEIGLEQSVFGDNAAVIATWFDQRFTNLIQYVASPAAPGSPNYLNLGEAKSAGLELEGRAYARNGASLNANWTWLHTRVLDKGTGADNLFQLGETLIRRPTHRLTVSVTAPIAAHASILAAIMRVGERDDLDFLNDFRGERITMPAYTTVNLGGDVRPLRAVNLDVGFRIDNLLGEKYREIANFPSAGRSLHLTARTTVGF